MVETDMVGVDMSRYDREEAGRQQDATEAMIRMRSPASHRSVEAARGPIGVPPRPVQPNSTTLACENLFSRHDGAPVIYGRVWTFRITTGHGQVEFVRTEDADGNMVGEVAALFSTSAVALSEDTCLLLSLFMAGEWNTLEERLVASVS